MSHTVSAAEMKGQQALTLTKLLTNVGLYNLVGWFMVRSMIGFDPAKQIRGRESTAVRLAFGYPTRLAMKNRKFHAKLDVIDTVELRYNCTGSFGFGR